MERRVHTTSTHKAKKSMLPINKTDFWTDRIKRSSELGDIHHSVYISRNELWKQIEAAHFDILKREVEPNMKVLDGGCGYGRCAPLFNKYVGIDFSPDFIQLAREKNPGKVFMQMDLTDIKFESGFFDIAFCISIKAMVEGNLGEEAWAPMLKELMRVANKVIILEYENPQNYEIY